MRYTKENIEKFISETDRFVLDSFEKIDGVKSIVNVKCKKCNNISTFLFHNFKNRIDTSIKCFYCESKKFMNNEKFLYLFNKRKDANEYYFIDEYQKNQIPIKVKHLKCGLIFMVRPNDLLHNNAKCPKCSNRYKYTFDDLKKRISDIDSNYELLDANQDSKGHIKIKSNVKIRHNVCGKEFEIIAHNFIHNHQRCRCEINEKLKNILKDSRENLSEGVRNIKNVLDSYNVEYQMEKKFEWLKYKKKMRLDFFLPEYNIAIEFDGKQHYMTNKSNKIITQNDVNDNKFRDKLKDKLCKEHNINIIRYNYLDSKEYIEESLIDIIKNNKFHE